MTRYAVRLDTIKNKPVEKPMYVSPKNRDNHRRGYIEIVKKFSETPVTTWTNAETAQKWADKMSLTVGDTVHYLYVVEEVQA